MTVPEIDGPSPKFRWRLRLIACCASLVALSFVQQPGRIIGDTKVDIAVDPALFLSKVLHLWDPIGAFGQVQNQAYGYLFPMGPFFLLGRMLELDPWVVQRLWWSLVFIVAFLGVVKLCGVLNVGTPWVRVFAGFVFALSPRMITNQGPISIENWPSSIAPWVLIPLIVGAQRGSAKRAAALSGLAAACVGAVNAVATAAILPISIVWLLTRKGGKRRRTLALWWPIFVVLGTLWWLVPLLLLGRFSPPFLDYIESAQATTAPATIFDALRGTTKWVPYIAKDYVPGRQLLTDPLIVLNTGLLMIGGVIGLARRGLRERRFWILTLMLGVLLVTMGHMGNPQGVFAEDTQQVLDGALAPFRNTHKWDVLIRLPLVIGLAHLVSTVGKTSSTADGSVQRPPRLLQLGTAVLALSALIGGTVTAWTTELAPAGSFYSIPGYWTKSVDWLEAHDDGRRTLMTPGSGFGDYTWGTPMDEVIQSLSRSTWATRNVIPLVPGGNIRMLDAIESRFSNGTGSPALASYLRRSGIGYLLVRNDLRRQNDVPNPERIYEAIRLTPGLTKVAGFGPLVGGEERIDTGNRSAAFVEDGWQSRHQAVEIFKLDSRGAQAPAAGFETSYLPILVGDSESLLKTIETGAIVDQPVGFARDADLRTRPRALVLTDGTRRQEVEFGRIHSNRSASLGTNESWLSNRPVHDYDTGGGDEWRTVPQLEGAKAITASSSASNVGYFGEIAQVGQPFSSFDNDPATSWVSAVPDRKKQHWLRVQLEHPVDIANVTISAPNALKASPRPVSISTSSGSVTTQLTPGDEKTVAVKAGSTSFVKVTASTDIGQPLRISELKLPGVSISRPLVLPSTPSEWGVPKVIVLSTDAAERSGCATVSNQVRCVEGAERLGEDGRKLDRIVKLHASAKYPAHLQASPWGGNALDKLIQDGRLEQTSATSSATHQAQSGPIAAVDGDPDTGWIAATDDREPTLRLSWGTDRRVSSVKIDNSRGLVASVPTTALLSFDDGEERPVRLVDGFAKFKATTTTGLRIRLLTDDPATSVSLDGSTGRSLPVGVSEITFPGSGIEFPDLSDQTRSYACGTGPTLDAGGTSLRTRVVASPQQLYEGLTTFTAFCDTDPTVALASGENRISVTPSDAMRPTSVLLGDPRSIATNPARSVTIDRWDATRRKVSISQGDTAPLLVVHENQSEGWVAKDGDQKLRALTVDGWQQGFAASASTTTIRLVFAPDRIYRAGLYAGIVGFLIVLLVGVYPLSRRRSVQSPPPLGALRIGAPAGLALLSACGILVASWSGLAAAVGGWVLGYLVVALQRRLRIEADPSWWIGVPLAIGLGAYVLHPWAGESTWAGSMAAWPQLLAAGSLGLAVALVFDGARIPTFFKRIKERSTTT